MLLFSIISNYIVISRLMTIWLFCVRWFCAKLCIKANGFFQRMGPDWFINGTGQNGVLNSQPRYFSLNTSLSEQFSTTLQQHSHSWIHSRFCCADVLPPWHISWTNLTTCQLYLGMKLYTKSSDCLLKVPYCLHKPYI